MGIEVVVVSDGGFSGVEMGVVVVDLIVVLEGW